MNKFVVLLLMLLSLISKSNGRVSPIGVDKICSRLPATVLTDVLGAAYNARYMSIDSPVAASQNDATDAADVETEESYNRYAVNALERRRGANSYRPFYVDDTYVSEISDQPAWEVKHVTTVGAASSAAAATRRKRQLDSGVDDFSADADINVANGTRPGRAIRMDVRKIAAPPPGERPWKCEAKIKWLDLGIDYFPRYLRTVECTKQFCWYGHYECRPRSFTVKILRRRNGECVSTERLHKIGVDGMPGELRELWVWEERAVNFCCDCAIP